MLKLQSLVKHRQVSLDFGSILWSLEPVLIKHAQSQERLGFGRIRASPGAGQSS